jgi:hypothetical protein
VLHTPNDTVFLLILSWSRIHFPFYASCSLRMRVREGASVVTSCCCSRALAVFTSPFRGTSLLLHISSCKSPRAQYTLRHVETMLTYPDRQKFDRIRAQWEAPRTPNNRSSKMVARKDRQVTQPLNAEQPTGSGSRFRRKLSHGLSFISNPLSQRKTLTGGEPLAVPMREPTTRMRALTTSAVNDKLRLPIYEHTTTKEEVRQRTPSRPDVKRSESEDPDATPKPLPRSRTMSFIPRPARGGSESSTMEIDSPWPPAFIVEEAASVTPTKIPTPSPPPDNPRRPSPRNYTHHYTTQQAKHIAAGAAFAGSNGQSPSKASVRSYTTPNLVQGPKRTQRTFMMPRKPAAQNKSVSPPKTQRPTLKENTPTGKQANRRISENQAQQLKRPSWGPQTTVFNRGPLGPSLSFDQSKQAVRTTPLKAGNRLSSNLSVQTPLTSKRISVAKVEEPLPPSSVPQKSQGSSIAQPRLLGVVNPPTSTDDRLALPRASTERNLRRMTLGTPSSRVNVPSISRCATGINTEVRFPHSSLPRASTFHNLRRRREPPPPVPAIPERYRSPSHLTLIPLGHDHWRHDAPHGSQVVQVHRRDPDLEANTPLGTASSSSVSLPSTTVSDGAGSTTSSPLDPYGINATLDLLDTLLATYRFSSTSPMQDIGTSDIEQTADIDHSVQVMDSMPPLWWAGRFQTRFDQWRHDAMRAELDPRYKPEGLLAQCKLSQDKIAACYIFLQLRDLCGSHRAADSLWVRQCHPFGCYWRKALLTEF